MTEASDTTFVAVGDGQTGGQTEPSKRRWRRSRAGDAHASRARGANGSGAGTVTQGDRAVVVLRGVWKEGAAAPTEVVDAWRAAVWPWPGREAGAVAWFLWGLRAVIVSAASGIAIACSYVIALVMVPGGAAVTFGVALLWMVLAKVGSWG